MTSNEAKFDAQIERIRALVPSGVRPREYIGQLLDEHLGAASIDMSMGIVPAPMTPGNQVLASARITAEAIEDVAVVAARPEGIVFQDLSVIEWLLRPALLLRGGCFERATFGPWADLTPDVVKRTAESVCRIDVATATLRIHVGTGFVAGRDVQGRRIVLTNAHVVEGASQYGWPLTRGLDLACDFACESTVSQGLISPVAREARVHAHYDMAMLYLPPDRASSSEPLAVAASPPDTTIGLTVGVVGHPSFNSNIDPFPKLFGFGAELGVKRFSPGTVRGLVYRRWRDQELDVLVHDATTLSGSSGSCIIDLTSGRVVGLHFGGWPLADKKTVRTNQGDMLAELFESNGAVPLWKLEQDPFLDEILWAL